MAMIHPPILCQTNAEGEPVLHYALKMRQLSEFFKPLQNSLERRPGLTQGEQGEVHISRSYVKAVLDCARELVNAEGKSLVYMATENGDVEALRALMALPVLTRTYRLRSDGPDGSALHVAVRERKYDIAHLLLQYNDGIISLGQDGSGRTPLHLAITMSDRKMIELLIKEVPQLKLVEVWSKDGFSPLHCAVSEHNLEIFRLLLQLCPECYLRNTIGGQNVLHLAVKEKATEIVEFIVKDERMANDLINQKDNGGNTPLHIAASDGNKKMLNILLASPLQVRHLKNKEGLTFIDISREQAARKRREKQLDVLTATQSFHSSLLVVATLITTVTFTAAFTMPGGYKSDGGDQGEANLVGRAAFKVFIVADAISMCSSVIATATLVLFSVMTVTRKKFLTLMVAISSIVVSIIFMLLAFTVGVWVVIPKCKWLAILIVIVTSCAPLLIALVFRLITEQSESEDD